jgi:hypothetical protein
MERNVSKAAFTDGPETAGAVPGEDAEKGLALATGGSGGQGVSSPAAEYGVKIFQGRVKIPGIFDNYLVRRKFNA